MSNKYSQGPEFSKLACRVFKQMKELHGLPLESDDDAGIESRREWLLAYHTELGNQMGGKFAGNVKSVAQKFSANKGDYPLPPLPGGKRGRYVSKADKSAAEVESIATMAEAGFEPQRDENGQIVRNDKGQLQWVEIPEVAAE
jgi:hypothetical protein